MAERLLKAVAHKVKKSKQQPSPSLGDRVPVNYYRRGSATTGASSPFSRKTTKRGRTRKYLIRLLDSVLIILLLAGLAYSLLVKSTPQIQLNDSTYHSAADYQAVAAKQLGSLKNRNKITLNEQSVIDALQAKFPEIASASLELPIFSETPIIHLTVAKPNFFLSNNGQDYIIDSEGVATNVANKLPQIKNLTTLSDQSGFTARPGQQVLSAQSVSFINNLLVQTNRASVPVKSLVLPPQAEELDLRTTDQSYYVKFYLGGDPILQTGQLLAARHNFAQSGKQPAEYLDVRVPGKVFYK